LPNITDSDVIEAFLAGTTCRDLVSKLGRKTPTKASELMDIATKFASGQEAVKVIFRRISSLREDRRKTPLRRPSSVA
jgi:predicted nucleotidyltransferase